MPQAKHTPGNVAPGRKGFVPVPLLMRVADKIETPNGPAGCWVWIGSKWPSGYGQVWFKGRQRPAHVALYEHAHGAIPDGMELDHLCRNKACCNPAHIEPVTHRENMLRHHARARQML